MARVDPKDDRPDWWPVAQGQPLSPKEIATSLEAPESGVYQNLRLLESRGLIRRRKAEHGTAIEVSAQVMADAELYRQLLDSRNPGKQESRKTGKREKRKEQAPPPLPPLPQSPSPPIPPTEAENIPPNGGAPEAPERKFQPEMHELVNALYNFLQVREALPPTPKDRERWRIQNLNAAKAMLDPSGGKPLADWLSCFEWAGAQPFWAPKITSLNKLRSVWSEYQMQRGHALRNEGTGGRQPSGIFAAQQAAYEQALREEAASEEV